VHVVERLFVALLCMVWLSSQIGLACHMSMRAASACCAHLPAVTVVEINTVVQITVIVVCTAIQRFDLIDFTELLVAYWSRLRLAEVQEHVRV